ncbi:MAG: rhodanese-like domain-containing protein [Cyanobacteria bacterium P01_D01_bin.128]
MVNINNAVEAAQELATEISPAPVAFDRKTAPADIQARLNWGAPALTILDVRDRDSFNTERIMGAVSMPLSVVVERAQNTLEADREIYIYGVDDAESAKAAQKLQDAGFKAVSMIDGGLQAWKIANCPTEGRV